MKRPPRETYVRTSRPCSRLYLTLEPGVEFRPGDDFEFVTGMLYDICYQADRHCECCNPTPMELAERAAELIVTVWPDRAYFVEAHDHEGWIQIYQPYGVPRNAASPLARAARWLRALARRLTKHRQA